MVYGESRRHGCRWTMPVMNSKAEIPWLRTLVFSVMLAALFSTALVLLTGDWYIASILFLTQTLVFFVMLVVGVWWSDSRKR